MMDSSNRMDPMFMAYMEVFKERNIKRMEVRCRECNKRLGYRMVPIDYDIVADEYDLRRGYCECRCEKSRVWEVCRNYNGESYICVYEH